MNAREVAVRLLRSYEENDTYVNLSLQNPLVSSLSEEDRSFVTALLYTVIERKITLDYYIASLAGRPVSDISPKALSLLRIGLAQILYMQSVPDYAAVSETVSLARGAGERGFVNGILRAALRKKDGLSLPPREKNLFRHLSVRYSVPVALAKFAVSLLGEKEAEDFLSASLQSAPLTLAVNTLRIAREDFLLLLEKAGVAAERCRYSPYGVRILSSAAVAALPGYKEGFFFVQDEASQIAALALAPTPEARAADVCAAPGGKSMLLAVQMQNRGEVRSFDLHASKLPLISQSAERLGLSIVSAREQDAVVGKEELFGACAFVLCDAPCSGLGVLSKKPDLRYRAMDGREELPDLQKKILFSSARYLAEGGTLVYSTCTLRPEENEQVVQSFLSAHPDFSLVPFSVGDLSAPQGMLTTYPHIHGMDGFFVAKMKRAAR